ncbi:non-selective voltage-gated ion channel VDAC1-like [Marmota flaviventris]|uniref:non-selective voltage-gated ion channel VDAC1-like n=1 Tax=Marmota flaviventris TaxID=93162 RepID=UPI003A8858AD
MAVPPTYADLGKFAKGYGFGLIKLDLKTKSENGLEFTTSGSANPETTKVTGSLETEFRWTEYGLMFTEKWNTLGTEITIEDQLARGLKLTFDSYLSPNTGGKNAKIKTGYNYGTEFGGSIYQNVNKKLEMAVNLSWTAGNSNTHFGIAAKYQVDFDACFSAKVNNYSLMGLGYTQTLKPSIKLTLSL